MSRKGNCGVTVENVNAVMARFFVKLKRERICSTYSLCSSFKTKASRVLTRRYPIETYFTTSLKNSFASEAIMEKGLTFAIFECLKKI